MISRRNFLLTGSIAATGSAISARTGFAASNRRFDGLSESLAQLEKENNGRLGVAVLDTGSGASSGYRTNERFAMCSTFKMLLAANVLHRVDAGKESLNRTIVIPAKIVLVSSPITQEHAGGSMPVRDLCAAIITRSDNTAANLLLDLVGGPVGITQFARSFGDTVTRLDRTETTLNEALPGDPRDTTSPAAMVATWRKLLLGDTLSAPSRKQLADWLITNKTGDERLRKGLKVGWIVGDKTGANGENTTNDVAIIWPSNQAPVLVAAYLTACAGTDEKRNAILADVGRLIAKSIA
jgi:beta-lactamase class A